MKDAKGHGSDGRGGGSNYARQAPTKNGRARMYGSSMADRIKVAQDQQNIKEGRAAGSPGNPLGDAGTADSVRRSFQSLYGNTGGSMASRDRGAASALASGSKSQPVPIHDSMGGNNGTRVQAALGSMSRLRDTFKQGNNRHGESDATSKKPMIVTPQPTLH
jgi:hypothetical protein